MFGYRNSILTNTTGNVEAPSYGPYGTHYPSIVTNLNNGNLNGKHPTPASFSIMDTGNNYSLSRQIYKRAVNPNSNTFKKAINIGKSSLKEGLPLESFYTNRSYDNNLVKSKLRRVRSSGCVPPKKCSSIYNHQFTPNTFTQNSY